MSDDARWVRPAFLSLAALVGLVVLVWGLITGALGAFHISEPRYGRVDADQGDVANAFRSVYAPLLELGQSQGTAPPGSEDAFRRAVADAEQQALDRAKDRGYNEAVRGAIAFVVGGFVLMVGSSGAKRAAARPGEAGSSMPAAARAGADGPAGTPATARAPARPQPPQRVRTGPPASATASPVGRLQEAPDAGRRPAARRPPAPAPKPATRRPQPAVPPAPARPQPVTPARPVAPPPPQAPRVAPARPVAPPPSPAPPAPPMPSEPPGGDAPGPEESGT